jgi:hypothetical protein
MKKPTLEQVIKLAAQLSPGDRQELFVFIAQLPDSAIKTTVEARMPLALEKRKSLTKRPNESQGKPGSHQINFDLSGERPLGGLIQEIHATYYRRVL